MDVAIPQLWTETVFGLTTGWWRFTDRDLRPSYPLLGRSQWETVLRETGFSETASLPDFSVPKVKARSVSLPASPGAIRPRRLRFTFGEVLGYAG